jgi:hypothetical protein
MSSRRMMKSEKNASSLQPWNRAISPILSCGQLLAPCEKISRDQSIDSWNR